MRAAVASLAVLVLGSLLLWQGTDGGQALTAEGARRLAALRDAPEVPQVVLTGADEQSLSLGGPADSVTLVEFVYTTCPTICQLSGADFARLRDAVVAEGLEDRVQLLSVSFDPANDGPEALAAYGAAHGADGRIWSVAVPEAADLPALLDAFGVVVIPGPFGFEHNIAIHVVDPRGRLVAITDADDIAGALAAAQRAAG